MGDKYKEARELIELEKKDKENIRTEKEKMQAGIESLREEIFKLREELGNENRMKEHISIKKKTYKAKLSLANQRLKHFCSSLDQMALLIYQRVLQASSSVSEKQKLENLEYEINNLSSALDLKQSELKRRSSVHFDKEGSRRLVDLDY